ncbi:MAG: Na/Pi cotransporter family protein [Kiritimatiellales bacterium]
MNTFLTVFAVLGGLALFIFGMNTITVSLQRFAGDGLRRILARAARSRLHGIGFGTTAGTLMQSSASVAMIISFANAGLLTLPAAIPVILGANIGTTLSMQLISFRLSDYSFAAIAVGFLLKTALPQDRLKSGGEALLGLGLLFLGLSTMSTALAGHRDFFSSLFAEVSGTTVGGMFRGILFATALSAVIHSGATLGMSFALIQAGVITDLSGVFPIIIGANIGTCVAALVGSIGTHVDARRSALAHLLFNLFSGTAALVCAPLFYRWIPRLPGGLVHQAANANMFKMILSALVVLPFTPFFAALLRRLLPSAESEPPPSFLDERLIPAPEQAIHAAMRELQRTVNICRESLHCDRRLLAEKDERSARIIAHNEKTIDALKPAFRDYLAKITSRFLSRRQAVLVQHLDRCITEIERIGDHLKVLCSLNEKLLPYTQHAFFTTCREQLEGLYEQLEIILSNLSISLDPAHETYEAFAEQILAARKEYVQKSAAAKDLITGHVGRNHLPPLLGIYLNETVMTFDKIVKHCKAIAGAQKKPFFWLKRSKLERQADEYTEQKILQELDAGDYLDTQ